MKSSLLALVLLVLVAAPAHADRAARARALFAQKCAHCHTVGEPARAKERSLVELGDAVEKRGEQALRAFLANPRAQKQDARCQPHVVAGDIEVLVGWLKARATSPKGAAPEVPPEQSRPPRPEPIVPQGQGSRR
jgi:mono/diheme cytochrome c family protein